MKRVLALLFVLFFTLSCTEAIRYTVEEIEGFPPDIQDQIKQGEITTGMTLVQVRYAWGAPDLVTVLSPTEDGLPRIEWTYKKLGLFKTILRFTDGKLTEIISTEPGMLK